MSDTDRDFDELAERLDEEYPRAWRPGWEDPKAEHEVDGDTIMGVYLRTDRSNTRRGEPADVLVLATHPTGELRSVWLLHYAVREKISVQGLEPGDKIVIRQNGMVESKTNPGQTYMDYSVAVKRRGAGDVPVPPIVEPTAADYNDVPPDEDPELPAEAPPTDAELAAAGDPDVAPPEPPKSGRRRR